MIDLYSDDYVIIVAPGLTPDRLVRLLEARLLIPTVKFATSGDGWLFTRIDVTRLQFLCELSDDLGLDEPTHGVVMALVDNLHTARNDLRNLVRAVDAEAPEVRARIGTVLTRTVP